MTRKKLTNKAREFVHHNATRAIVAGVVLTSKKRPILTADDNADVKYLRYSFDDRSIRTLQLADMNSMLSHNLFPRWAE